MTTILAAIWLTCAPLMAVSAGNRANDGDIPATITYTLLAFVCAFAGVSEIRKDHQ